MRRDCAVVVKLVADMPRFGYVSTLFAELHAIVCTLNLVIEIGWNNDVFETNSKQENLINLDILCLNSYGILVNVIKNCIKIGSYKVQFKTREINSISHVIVKFWLSCLNNRIF